MNITNQRFGRLVVEAETSNRFRGQVVWRCKCDCGKTVEVAGYSLRTGMTKSCGCLRSDGLRARSKKHGHACGATHTATYRSWVSMRRRCNDPKAKSYSRYGGRGITICDRWEDFECFLLDMGTRQAGMTLERKDVSGNYCPENCIWSTAEEQSNNRTSNRFVEVDGVRITTARLAKKLGMRPSAISSRLNLGWSLEEAMNRPMKKHNQTEKLERSK